MPDEKPAAERTEQPTPERLKRAREQGQIPQSMETPSALMIVMLLVVLALTASNLYGWFVSEVRQGLSVRNAGPMEATCFSALLKAKAAEVLLTMLPFLLIAAAVSILASLIGSGWAFAPKAVRFRLDRISPVKGLKNLFNVRSAVHLVVSVAKLVVILTIVYIYLHDKLDLCLSLRHATPAGAMAGMARLVFGAVARIAVALVAIAVVELLFQRWKYKHDLRMTRQEVLEERKRHEISPQVKGRIRAVGIELARKRMLQEVPAADVVVTNPTHVAVALRYDAENMDAPQVVAKGGDLLCEKIKEIARSHNVPIVQRPELARTLYGAVDIGQAIPENLFLAVAEVLAMIYRLRSRRRGTAGNKNR